MKILHVITDIDKSHGGTSEVAPRLCRALQELGHDVTLAFCPWGEISETGKDALKAGVRMCQYRRFPVLAGALAYSVAFHRDIDRLVESSDIVHIHGLWQTPGWLAAASCRRLGKPYLMMPHGFLEPMRLKISRFKKEIVGSLFERRCLRAANALVATAPSEAEGFQRYGLSNPVHVMPIGLDLGNFGLATFHKASASSSDTKRKRLLYFSRITPVKGLDMLVEAWAKLREFHNDWELVIAGPDDRGYAHVLQSHIQDLGLHFVAERHGTPSGSHPIVFTGPVYGAAKFAMLQSADAFVLPTRSENWSIAVAEAMATGLPVVCTRGAPWECIAQCNAGRWVDVSVPALVDGLRQVLATDLEGRRTMGRNGRHWVETHLNWDKIARDMVSFYEVVG